MNADDLTRQIVDTDARVKALRTLRDRLQTLLEEKPGEVGDLLQVERELARVQGELDATQSNLAVMRERVDMSVLNIRYETERKAVSPGVFTPLNEAIRDAASIFFESIATLIRWLVAALPFAVVGLPLLWLGKRFIFGRKKH